MKNIYLVATEEKDGKYCSYMVSAPYGQNIFNYLPPHLMNCTLVETKRKAQELAQLWNDCYKRNGTYMFA